MAQLTEKGLAKLETLRDYSAPPTDPASYAKLCMKYLLQEIEKNFEFYIKQHSTLRPDWDKLKDQRLIIDTSSWSTNLAL